MCSDSQRGAFTTVSTLASALLLNQAASNRVPTPFAVIVFVPRDSRYWSSCDNSTKYHKDRTVREGLGQISNFGRFRSSHKLATVEPGIWHDMATDRSNISDEDRIRSTVLRQAKDIEDRKKLQCRIADLVVDAFDLPSSSDADPADPEPSDASLFRHCLSLFQASDLDDLIYERNVDNRCGYGLCPRPNQKLAHGGVKVWNQRSGKDFKLVDKMELERWCSRSCQERTAFVRAQLGTEPAWLRMIRAVNIKLLDEVESGDLTNSFNVCLRNPPTCHIET